VPRTDIAVTAYKKEIDLGEIVFIRVNSIADPHPPKISKILIGALETDRLRDRVEQLEQLVGVDRSLTSRLRTAFGLEPGVAQVMGSHA